LLAGAGGLAPLLAVTLLLDAAEATEAGLAAVTLVWGVWDGAEGVALWVGGDLPAGTFAGACAFALPGSNPIINSGARRKNAPSREINRMNRPNRHRPPTKRRIVQESTKPVRWNRRGGAIFFKSFPGMSGVSRESGPGRPRSIRL
jgi:hypothetical protein